MLPLSKTICAAALLSAGLSLAAADTTLVGWEGTDLGTATSTDPWPVSTIASNLTATGWTRGSGLMPMDNNYYRNSFVSRSVTEPDLASAVANDDYISVTLTPGGGQSLSLTAMNFLRISAQNLPPEFTMTVMSSRTGFTVDDALGNINPGNDQSFDLSGVAELQNVSEAIELRIYAFGHTGGDWKVFYTGINGDTNDPAVDDVTIVGSLGSSGPTPLTGLQALAVSHESVQLTWEDVTGESGYQIMRNGVEIDVIAADSTSYTDTGLTPETLYEYTVNALD